MVAQPTRVDGRRHEGVPQGEHFDNGRHLSGIAEVEGIRPARQGGGGGGLNGYKAGVSPVEQILAQEGVSDPGEV